MAYRSRVVFSERSRPEIFCCVLEGRRSRSTWLLKRTVISEQAELGRTAVLGRDHRLVDDEPGQPAHRPSAPPAGGRLDILVPDRLRNAPSLVPVWLTVKFGTPGRSQATDDVEFADAPFFRRRWRPLLNPASVGVASA
jgi:hypothetical protein